MLTYKKLGLSREHKYIRNRGKVDEERLYRYIGEGDADRPHLKVLRADYLRTWREVNEKCASSPDDFLKGKLADLQKRRIERAVYDELARRYASMTSVEAAFQKEHKRGMTPHERSLYTRVLQVAEESGSSAHDAVKRRATETRRRVLSDVVQHVENSQRRQPARLQQAWASIVGEEIAQETLLEKVDAQQGVAVCRCLSSTLSFQLRRRKDLASQLSEALGLRVTRVIFR
ncbi:MAG: DciA family protein [bacterium]